MRRGLSRSTATMTVSVVCSPPAIKSSTAHDRGLLTTWIWRHQSRRITGYLQLFCVTCFQPNIVCCWSYLLSCRTYFLQRGRIACNAERCNSYGISVCPSFRLSHAGIVPRRMNRGSRGLHSEVAEHSSFLIPTVLGGDVPFHLKFALKVTHLLWKPPTSTNICL